MDDAQWLSEAIRLAEHGWKRGDGGPFGAVVVRGDAVVGQGWNQVVSDNDPTAHAEVTAIRRAGATMGTFDLTGTVLYASSEPCPLCLAASHWARLDRIVFAADRKDAADIGFDDALLYEHLAGEGEGATLVQRGPVEAQAAAVAVMKAWQTSDDPTPY